MVSTIYALDRRAPPRALQPSCANVVQASGAWPAEERAPCRVLIANRQPIVRHGVRALLAREPDIEVVAETDSGTEAVRLARQLRPDIVLIDLLMPAPGGIAVTRMIHTDVPDTQVIVMTGVDEDAAAIEVIRAGAVAYLSNEARVEVLLRTIRGAATGQVALPAEAAVRLMRTVRQRGALSEREAEVLRLVARGLANKQIAGELGVSLSTIKSHVSSILAKLSVPTRTQLVLYAARTGLVAIERHELDAADEQAPSANGMFHERAGLLEARGAAKHGCGRHFA
jgi:DNA-binding NarL/FixJ family response regulator